MKKALSLSQMQKEAKDELQKIEDEILSGIIDLKDQWMIENANLINKRGYDFKQTMRGYIYHFMMRKYLMSDIDQGVDPNDPAFQCLKLSYYERTVLGDFKPDPKNCVTFNKVGSNKNVYLSFDPVVCLINERGNAIRVRPQDPFHDFGVAFCMWHMDHTNRSVYYWVTAHYKIPHQLIVWLGK